jgi:extracellular factor (EF) 3-hydroxypalmitic acid methyl ester biosynthesis protein
MSTQALLSSATFELPEGGTQHCGLVRLNRHSAILEVHSPVVAIRAGEALTNFVICRGSHPVYSGRAVVRNQFQSETRCICEVGLSDESWNNLNVDLLTSDKKAWDEGYRLFLADWEDYLRIKPDYKLTVADMESFLSDLSVWLTQIEHGISQLPETIRSNQEKELSRQLAETIIPSIDEIFDKFEEVAIRLNPVESAAHAKYMRQRLHSLAMLAPFAYRTFAKPLGYAGDYEMVNMILRNRPEGKSLFGKVLHAWFVNQQPAKAHRNRISYLIERIIQTTLRARAVGQQAEILNIACGPASEVERFISESELRSFTEFTLLDFNVETLSYTKERISAVSRGRPAAPKVTYVQRSVHHLLKDGAKRNKAPNSTGYHLVYCAGLFDYLTDEVCCRLMDLMYDWVLPGGLLVATNVEPNNPRRHGMDHLLDWPLIYRTANDMMAVKPKDAHADCVRVYSDDTGVNVFLEATKPTHGRT